MINLLTAERKIELRAARRNVALRSYVLLGCVSLVILSALFFYAFYTVARQQEVAAAESSAAQKALQAHEPTKQKATQYRSDLQIAKTILANEFSFTDFLTKTGNAMAPNTIIETVQLTTKPQTVQQKGQITIEARAKSYNDALALKESLESSELFSNVSTPSIFRPDRVENEAGIAATYLYSVVIEAVVPSLQGVR